MSLQRKTMLGGVSTLVLAALIGAAGSAAQAAGGATLTLPTRDGANSSAVAQQAIDSVLTQNGAAVNATVTNSQGSVQQTNANGDKSSTTVTGNMIGATGTGNVNNNTVDQIDATTTATPPGVGVLAVSNNAATTVNSAVNGSSFTMTLNNATAGTAIDSNNSIMATTALNQAANLVSGTLPSTFAPATAGTVNHSTAGTPSLTSTAGIALSNDQTNAGGTGESGPSSARLNTNSVALTDTTAAGAAIALSPDVSGNTLAAQLSGNTADNAVRIAAGGSNSLGGTVALSNTQQNNDTGAGTYTASNLGSTVSAALTATGGGNNTLTGALTVNNNTISSAATGNNALTTTGGTLTGGNVVVIADGINVAASNAGAPTNSFTGTDAAAPAGTLAADLGVFNGQLNQNGVSATTGGTGAAASTISATAQSLGAGGSVALTGNAIRADANNNLAYDAIQAGGATTSAIAAQSAIGSVQTNGADAAVTATNTNGSVTADVGTAAGETVAGRVAATGNTIESSAYGDSVGNLLSLNANTLTTTNPGSGEASDIARGTAFAQAGSSIVTVQNNLGGAVSATTTNPIVSVTLGNAGTALANASATASQNTLTATAEGNDSRSILGLTGTTVNTTAGVTNQQNDASAVGAAIANGGVSLTANSSGPTNPTLTASGNVILSRGVANDGTSALTVTATSLTAPSYAPPPDGFTGNGLLNQFGVLNDQAASANVTSRAASLGVALTATGAATGGTFTADGNAIVGLAQGNAVANTTSLAANGITATNANTALAASVLNVQSVADGVAISGSVDTSTAGITVVLPPEIEVLRAAAVIRLPGQPGPAVAVNLGDLAASSVSASNGAVAAVASGNTAANGVTAATPSSDTTGVAADGAGFSTSAGGFSADYALGSFQSSGTGSRTATVTSQGVVVNVGSLTGSSVAASADQFSAQATDNNAVNALSLNGGTTTNAATGAVTVVPAALVSATATINNVQVSNSDVTATLGAAGARVGVVITPNGAVAGSTLTASNDLFQASALGNAAVNTGAVAANTVADIGGRPAAASLAGGTSMASGDLTLVNAQTVGTTTLSATTHGQVVIPAAGTSGASAVTGSALTASANAFQANAAANTAANTLGATGTDVGATTALVSRQASNAAVNADASDSVIAMTVGAVSGSTMNLIGDTSLASALGNTATNLVSASVGSTASANAALNNLQSNGGAVTATGGLTMTYAAASGASSTVAMTGNASSAVAGGNTSSNTLSALANASYAGAAGAATAQVGAPASNAAAYAGTAAPAAGNNAASAQYAVLNGQTNTAAINATNTSSLTMAADAGTAGSFTNSTVINGNNRVTATGYGNSTLNTIALNSLPAGVSSAALTNQQYNTGNVTAAVSNTTVGITSLGTAGNNGSTLGVTNNAILANATGNSASNVIGTRTPTAR